MPDQPDPTLLIRLHDLTAFLAFVRPFVPADKLPIFDSLRRTDDGRWLVTAYGLDIELSALVGPAG